MPDLFAKSPAEIIAEAVDKHKPVKTYVCFSGGNDSLVAAHWGMNNIPNCELFHINTGIYLKPARQHVYDTVKRYGWPMTEISALEDCGSNYDDLVRKFGFPGPHFHHIMYRWLKERAVDLLVKRTKQRWRDRVLLITGVRHDESIIRMGYKGGEVSRDGAKVWANAIYWWTQEQRDTYLMENQIRRNPVSALIGISGECMCGAYAHPGEQAMAAQIDPEWGARVVRLHEEIKHKFPWAWEDRPPEAPRKTKPKVGPLCIGCEKSAIVQAEIAGL